LTLIDWWWVMVIALAEPESAVALAITLVATFIVWRRKSPLPGRTRSRWEFTLLLIPPLAVWGWAMAFHNTLSGVSMPPSWTTFHWQALGIDALLALQVAMAIVLLLRHRNRLRLAAPLAFFAVWGTGALAVIAGMAVYGRTI